MTPAEFKAARKAFGWSANQMAAALKLGDGRAIRQYESGGRSISGPIETLIRTWVDHPETRPGGPTSAAE